MSRLILSAALCLSAGIATAETLHVRDRDTDGLVRAIELANARPGHDRIVLAEGGTYVFEGHGPALPAVYDRLSIDGRGSVLLGYSERPLSLIEVATEGDLRLKAVTLSGATTGAIRNYGRMHLERVRIEDNFSAAGPSAIDNRGRMVLRESVVAFNTTQGPDPVGAVRNAGHLRMQGCVLKGNTALANRSSARAVAAVSNAGEAAFERVKVSANEVVGLDQGRSALALANQGSARMSVRDSVLMSAVEGTDVLSRAHSSQVKVERTRWVAAADAP